MSDSKIEQVAKAIGDVKMGQTCAGRRREVPLREILHGALGGGIAFVLSDALIEAAGKAAIEAMREPTEAMLDCLSTHGPGSNIVTHDQWRAAIDAALSEGE